MKAQETAAEPVRETGLSPAQQSLANLWDEHVRDEFATKDTIATLDYDGARRLREPHPRADRRRWP